MAITKVEGVFRNLPITSMLNAFAVMEDEDKIKFLNIFIINLHFSFIWKNFSLFSTLPLAAVSPDTPTAAACSRSVCRSIIFEYSNGSIPDRI